MHILHIDSSASDGVTSHSRRLSAELVEKLKAANAGATVTYRDVAKDRLPHVDMTIRQAWSPEGEKDSALSETAARTKAAVDELKAADVLVIGSPMYNFSVPSTLKSWIDHVVIAGQTFGYTESGPKGHPFQGVSVGAGRWMAAFWLAWGPWSQGRVLSCSTHSQ